MTDTPEAVATHPSRGGWPGVILALGLWLITRLPIWGANGWLGLYPWARVAAWVTGLIMMIGLPLWVRRTRPRLAAPAPMWLPRRKRDWVWALGLLVVTLTVAVGLGYSLTRAGFGLLAKWMIDDLWLSVPAVVVAWALVTVILCPIAEEIFYRGYLQTQLERVLPRWAAVVIQAVIFTIAHSYWVSGSLVILWYGLAFGWWRAARRSLLPIVLIHIAINAMIILPQVPQMYNDARLAVAVGATPEAFQSPQAQEARRISRLPPEQAVPQLLALTQSSDAGAELMADIMLHKHFDPQVFPLYIGYLESDDDQRIKQVVAHVGLMAVSDRELYLPLLPAIREAVRRSDMPEVHISAFLLFDELHDAEGLAVLAEHPKAKPNMREMAQRHLDQLIK